VKPPLFAFRPPNGPDNAAPPKAALGLAILSSFAFITELAWSARRGDVLGHLERRNVRAGRSLPLNSADPALVGRGPREIINALRMRMDEAIKFNPLKEAAVEMGKLWDIAGQGRGFVPVYQLPAARAAVVRKIPIKMMIGAFDQPQAVGLRKRFS